MLDRAATVEEALALLEGCSQESTRWSAVYDQAGGEVLIAVGRDYQNVHRFRLDMAVEGTGRANGPPEGRGDARKGIDTALQFR